MTVQTDREPAAEELVAKYREIIKTHLAASAAPRPEKVSPRDEPKAQLEEIIVRSAVPSKESHAGPWSARCSLIWRRARV